MIFKKIWSYITFRKQTGVNNLNTRLMHGMNRISILMFLVAIVVILFRIFRKH